MTDGPILESQNEAPDDPYTTFIGPAMEALYQLSQEDLC